MLAQHRLPCDAQGCLSPAPVSNAKAFVKIALPDIDTLKRLVLTFTLGTVGGLVFSLLGLPAPWLSGPIVTVAAGVLLGFKLGIPTIVRHAAYILLGAIMGTAMTPETMTLLSRWPITLAGLTACVLSVMIGCSFYLQRVHGYDRTTAKLSSVPGALPYVLALAEESNGDPRRIAIIQIFRLAIILVFLPSAIYLLGGAAETIHQPMTHPVDLIEVATLLAAGCAAAYVFVRLKAPAPTLFGPLVAGAILYVTGTLTTDLPSWVMLPAFLVIGCAVGSNFAGIDRHAIADSLLASLGSLGVGVTIAIVWAVIVAWIVNLPIAQLWMAYAPGGIDGMTILALALGHDAAFVGGHHVIRFMALGFIVPVWLRR